MVLSHGKTLVLCSHCKATSHSLWRTNVCHICMKYFYNLVEHEPSHYKDKEGSNALYECPHCYRSFARFPELKSHLVRHKKSCVKQYFKCQKCSSTFRSHHLRDQHIISHYKTIFDKIWEKFWSTQTCNKKPHCPLCSFMVTNKKSFRLHIIHRHANGFSSEKLEELLSSLMTKFQAESDILKEFIEEQDEDFINNNSSAMNISDQRIEIVMDGPNEVSANESTAVQYEEQNCSPASIREKFISACLDINTNDLPKCTKCDCIFRHMVDFELHVIRDHSSDLIYNRCYITIIRHQ
ncbi:unnamed protein product [Dracunculus medinensis]|uniref:C2H2-type domain-containing protein n=1 Tax=Dracunculus medinensis TaxID=318479 RepID=A0A0N4UGF4_DRAME|nr:unnamed protein product [Dracunculus medinensis]